MIWPRAASVRGVYAPSGCRMTGRDKAGSNALTRAGRADLRLPPHADSVLSSAM
jgi:hypothetical protein